MAPLRWGICSAGKISSDFVASTQNSTFSADHKFEAVAARDIASAQEFAKKFNIPRAYGSYEELAEDKNLDVVYVGTIHTRHVELSLLFLRHGKHVLVEKPMAIRLQGVVEVLETARANNLFFMESFWSRTFPLHRKVREYVQSGRIGQPLTTQGRLMIPIGGVPRIARRDMGGGGLLDIGCYLVSITNQVFPGKPVSVKVEGSLFPTGVDSSGCILIRYSCGGVANLAYDTRVDGLSISEYMIGGSKGTITIHPPFWCPTKMTGPDGEEEFPLYSTDYKFNFVNSQGLAFIAEEVRQCIAKGLLESPCMPHEASRTCMEIMEEVLKQLGVTHE